MSAWNPVIFIFTKQIGTLLALEKSQHGAKRLRLKVSANSFNFDDLLYFMRELGNVGIHNVHF